MYNLIISGDADTWDGKSFEIEKSRFLEYTNTNIVYQFKNATISDIKKLMGLPCLFAYERALKKNARIGTITRISDKINKYVLAFEFDSRYETIPYQDLEEMAESLDIRNWELNRTHWAIKDKDLVDVIKTKTKLNINDESKRKTINDLKIEKASLPKITTVKSFIEKVINSDSADEYEIYYRGHSNQKYKLVPSLYRVDEKGNFKFMDSESIMFNEMILANPSEFLDDSNSFEKLVRMQHYSLPTRLLDITSNPLIALFFACNTNENLKGEVIIFKIRKDSVKYYDSDTASCISNMAKLTKKEKDNIDTDLDITNFNNQDTIRKLHHYIKEEKPYFKPEINPFDIKKVICIKSKKSNIRISSQSGAFLLFGMDAIFSENGTENIIVNRIEIDKKKNILKELDVLNINESTVFPYIESSARYIASKFEFNP